MRRVKGAWKSGVVLVCGNERPPDADKASCGLQRGTELRGWLKDRIKKEGLKGRILSSRTTCLGICSKLGVTVDVVAVGGEHRTYLVESDADREALWAEIKATILGEGQHAAIPETPDEDL